jgi:type III secretory pathway component EscV
MSGNGNLTDRQIHASNAAFVVAIALLVLTFALPGFIAKLLCGVAAVFAVLIIVAIRAGSVHR